MDAPPRRAASVLEQVHVHRAGPRAAAAAHAAQHAAAAPGSRRTCASTRWRQRWLCSLPRVVARGVQREQARSRRSPSSAAARPPSPAGFVLDVEAGAGRADEGAGAAAQAAQRLLLPERVVVEQASARAARQLLPVEPSAAPWPAAASAASPAAGLNSAGASASRSPALVGQRRPPGSRPSAERRQQRCRCRSGRRGRRRPRCRSSPRRPACRPRRRRSGRCQRRVEEAVRVSQLKTASRAREGSRRRRAAGRTAPSGGRAAAGSVDGHVLAVGAGSAAAPRTCGKTALLGRQRGLDVVDGRPRPARPTSAKSIAVVRRDGAPAIRRPPPCSASQTAAQSIVLRMSQRFAHVRHRMKSSLSSGLNVDSAYSASGRARRGCRTAPHGSPRANSVQQVERDAHRAGRGAVAAVDAAAGQVHGPHHVPLQVAQVVGRHRDPLRLVALHGAARAVAQRAGGPAGVALDAAGELAPARTPSAPPAQRRRCAPIRRRSAAVSAGPGGRQVLPRSRRRWPAPSPSPSAADGQHQHVAVAQLVLGRQLQDGCAGRPACATSAALPRPAHLGLRQVDRQVLPAGARRRPAVARRRRVADEDAAAPGRALPRP